MDAMTRPDAAVAASDRILFVTNEVESPTLLLSFVEPLKGVAGVETAVITESDLKSGQQDPAAWRSLPETLGTLSSRLEEFAPTLILLCRYSGPCAPEILEWARAARVPTIYHIDDNLLQVPNDIGEAKARRHNEPRRLQTVRYLLDNTTLAYCSNETLRGRLFGDPSSERIVSGEINCASDILAPPTTDEPPVIGYMGLGSHDLDFTFALAGLVRILEARPDVRFEIFGSIKVPDALERFRDRITLIPPIRDYARFLEKLASLRWTIGICPLARTIFNAQKSNNKWVEYSACGFAVVATRGLIYDDCCADGCGILVDTDDEWFTAFDRLLSDKTFHRGQIERAQSRIRAVYSRARLRRQVLAIFARAHALADRPHVAKLSLDTFDGERVWGWAWRSSETSQPSKRQAVELRCGETLLGPIARRHDRPDADAYLGAPAWPKGFSAPVGAVVALCRLMGENRAFLPTVRFCEELAPGEAQEPLWRSLAAFRTLRAAEATCDWRVDDVWWANSHLLKARIALLAPRDGHEQTRLLRAFQPLRNASGRPALAVVDETPIDARKGVCAFGLRNPFMPVLFVGYDDAGDITLADLIPFPSLLRGGMHAAEAAALQEDGGLDALRRLNDACLAEAVDWGEAKTSPAIGEICVDLSSATGAEPIFEPQLREWISVLFGVAVVGANAERRIAADLGDRAFVDYAESVLARHPPAFARGGRLRLALPCCGIPTVSALVSRRLPASAAPTPASCLMVDAALPQRRFAVSLPADLPKAIQAATNRQSQFPTLYGLSETGEATTAPAQPAAILIRDLSPNAKEKLLYPVPPDAPRVLPHAEGDEPKKFSIFICPRDAIDMRLLFDSLARQKTAAKLEVALIGPPGRKTDADALTELFPGSAHIHETSSLSKALALNEAAAAASGDVLVFIDPRAILHDRRTLAAIGRLARLEDAATVGCMRIKPRNAADGAPAFSSAGYFPGRFDFALAPHLALDKIDCGALLADSLYPVAANSAHFYALSAAAWRQVGGMSPSAPARAMHIDLALRLAGVGRVNLCTTRLSVFSDASEAPKPLHTMAATAHADIWRLLPALQKSTIIRPF